MIAAFCLFHLAVEWILDVSNEKVGSAFVLGLFIPGGRGASKKRNSIIIAEKLTYML
jgi:hypothetical protein